MRNGFVVFAALALVSVPAAAQTRAPFVAAVGAGAPTPTPFANNNGQIPPNYPNPLFKLSHNYPSTLAPAPADPPWRRAIGDGVITTDNAGAYAAALKEYVAKDMRLLLEDSSDWKPDALGWYSEPWTGYLREATHGMYIGSSPFLPDLFNGSGLTKPFTTYVLTFYDRRAANALYKVWGATATKPNLTAGRRNSPTSPWWSKPPSAPPTPTWPVMQARGNGRFTYRPMQPRTDPELQRRSSTRRRSSSSTSSSKTRSRRRRPAGCSRRLCTTRKRRGPISGTRWSRSADVGQRPGGGHRRTRS